MSTFSIFFLNLIPVFWVTGVILPLSYLFYLLHIKKIFLALYKGDKYTTVLTIFIFIQLLSLLPALAAPYFTIERLFAILHNIGAFSFILLGYNILTTEKSKTDIQKHLKWIFYFLTISCIVAFSYSIYTEHYIQFNGVLGILTGLKNDLTMVSFNHEGWIRNQPFPRSRILGTFPNTTGILLLLIYILLVITSDLKGAKKLAVGLLFIAAVITTGSRTALCLAILLIAVSYVTSKKRIVLVLLSAPVSIAILAFFIIYLAESRGDSNESRLELYVDSLKLVWDQNIYTGLGMKPFVEEIANGEYPVGSHSTLAGYLVKNGIIGGIIALWFYFTLFLKGVRIIFTSLKYKVFESREIFIGFGLISILIALLFDDLDSYELLPFYFGLLLHFVKKKV